MKRGRPRPLAVACGLGALVVAAALLLPDGLSFDDGAAAEPLVPDLPAFFDVLLVALTVVTFVSIAVIVVGMSLRGDPSAAPRRRKSPVGLLVLIVLTGLVASLYAASGRGDAPDPPDVQVGNGGPDGAGSGDGVDGSRPLGLLVTGIVVLLIAGAPVAAWRYARRLVPEELASETFDERLLEEVDRSIADLATIGDPREAVIACYGRLQRLARWSGLDVRASDTSSELLDVLARRSEALEASAARLVTLFQTARFSPHPLGESDRTEALAALAEVRDRLVVTA